MKNHNIFLIYICLSFLTFSSKNLEVKILSKNEEDSAEYSNLRRIEATEDEEDPTSIGQSHYHKSSGGLSKGAVAGIIAGAVVVVAVAVVLSVVLKGVVVVGAATIGTTVGVIGAGAAGTFGGGFAGLPQPGMTGGPGSQFVNSTQYGLNNTPGGSGPQFLNSTINDFTNDPGNNISWSII